MRISCTNPKALQDRRRSVSGKPFDVLASEDGDCSLKNSPLKSLGLGFVVSFQGIPEDMGFAAYSFGFSVARRIKVTITKIAC
jgi:hypothetical protein